MMKSEVQDIPPLHDVDIRLLRVFKMVVESKGFSAAEEQLGVGRSTISKHISGLEDRFGFKLCERGRSGFSVTPHGEAVYSATIELLDALDSFRAKVATAKGFLSGRVSLWAMDNFNNEAGNPHSVAIEKFNERPGNVHLYVNAATPKYVEEAVASGMAHIGITIAKGNLPGISYVPISSETSSMYCSNMHPKVERLTSPLLTEEDLKSCDVVDRSYLRNDRPRSDLLWRSTVTSGHVEMTLQLILSGRFLGIVPDHIASRWVVKGAISKVCLASVTAKTDVYLLVRQKVLSNPAVKALVNDMLDAYNIPKGDAKKYIGFLR